MHATLSSPTAQRGGDPSLLQRQKWIPAQAFGLSGMTQGCETLMHMPSITLRSGTEADIPALLDLWVKARTLTMPEIDFETRRLWKLNRLRTMLSECADLTIAGCDGAVLDASLVNPSAHCLDQLVVTPSAWGRGVAKALAAHAFHLCPTGLSLTVNQENPRAIRFCEREGFVRSGEGVNPHSGRAVYHYAWTPSGASANCSRASLA
mgnify:CR=1 FL=1